MISKKDSKPFLVKFVIANTTDSAPKPVYGDWKVVSGLISDPKGSVVENAYGFHEDYDRVLILNATDTTRKIKEDTSILIDEYPTVNFPQGNYIVKRIFPEVNREITIGLIKKEGLDTPELYFVYNNQLLTYQLNFDINTNIGYVDNNRDVPFSSDTPIWTRKPASFESTGHKIKFLGSNSAGIDEYHKLFKELRFEDSNG